MEKRLLELIKANAVFSSLSKESCQALVEHGDIIEIAKDELLYDEGDAPDALYFLISGTLEVTRHLKEHSIKNSFLLNEPGTLIGEAGVFSNQPRLSSIRVLENSQLLKITREDYESFCNVHPADDNLISLIKSCRIFSILNLTQKDFEDIVKYMEVVDLEPEQVLFKQGEPSDYLCILISGRLLAVLTTVIGRNKAIGTIERGEVVGELGAISGEPRTLTIKALYPCKLLKLSKERINLIGKTYPPVFVEIINLLVARSRKTISLLAEKKHAKNIGIVALNEEVRLQEFKAVLDKYKGNSHNIIIFTDEERDTLPNVTELSHDTTIIYLLSSKETPLLNACYNKIEHIYILADAQAQPVYSETVAKLINLQIPIDVRRELIILHNNDAQTPKNTRYILDKLKFNYFSFVHYVRINHQQDYQRLLRFVCGTAIGLVLGGGGTRGWAHIGIIKALIENNIEVDAIGGSSIGALIGALYLQERSLEHILDNAHYLGTAIRKIFAFKNFSWPAVSLLSSRSGTSALQKVFDELKIEELWTPFFCMTCNLNTGKETVHRQGLIWEKIRASIALPGIIPPVVMDGQLHVDGGLLNNLPVDVMRNLFNNRGIIIAVNLNSLKSDESQYNFPPILPFKEAFLAKMGFAYKDYKFPRFFDYFINSFLVGASIKQITNTTIADLSINLDLAKFGLLETNDKYAPQLIDIGYASAREQFRVWKKDK